MVTSFPKSQQAIALPKWRRRALNWLGTAVLTVGAAAASFAVGVNVNPKLQVSSSAYQPTHQPLTVDLANPDPIEVNFDEISFGPLLDYLGSDEYRAFQENWYAQERERNLNEARNTLASAQEQAAKKLESAQYEADAVVADASYFFANFRSHGQPGEPVELQYDASVVEIRNTSIGCNATLRAAANGKRIVVTNMAINSCVKPGDYSQGDAIGRYGKLAVGAQTNNL